MRSIAAMILVAGLAIAWQAAAQTDRDKPAAWIADSKTGCKIWNPAPQTHESVRWSGGCKGGYATGKGRVQWYENGRPGDRYDGDYQAGKRNGHGVVTQSNGTRIEGDWRNDELLQMGVNEI